MSDPMRRLEGFSTEGLVVEPLPPSEVRRRGDRLRRRNHALAAVAAAAAVAVVAVPAAVLAGPGDQRGQEPPEVAPAEPEWVTTIPPDFPVGAGMADPSGAARPFDPGPEEAFGNLLWCGEDVWPARPAGQTDQRARYLESGPRPQTRELTLFVDEAAARAAIGRVERALADCAADRDEGSPESGDESTIRRERHELPLGEEAVAYTERWEGDQTAAFTIGLVRVGNAVVAGQAPDVHVEDGYGSQLSTLADSLTPVVARMCVFAAVPCREDASPSPTGPATDASPSPTGPATDGPSEPAGEDLPAVDPTIPAGFPLDAGFPTQSELGEAGFQGPGRELEPLELRACGAVLPDAPHEDRLVARYQSAEDHRTRQLTTYADAEAAVAASRALVDALRSCPEELRESDGHTTEREVRNLGVGGESWVVLERDSLDGAPSPFGSTLAVVRLGSAVLVVEHGGHAGYPTVAGVEELVSSIAEPVAAMCAFTLAGCGGA